MLEVLKVIISTILIIPGCMFMGFSVVTFSWTMIFSGLIFLCAACVIINLNTEFNPYSGA